MSRHDGILVIEGTEGEAPREFPGELFGAKVPANAVHEAKGKTRDKGYGEVVFNTSMTGYQEILTDPSYYGQIVCMTVPHVGNTGVNLEDVESRHPWCAGFVVHQSCDQSSSWRSTSELEAYLKENGIPGLRGVDTRAITRHLRSRGVARGIILPAADRARAGALLAELPKFEGRDMIAEVTTREPYVWDEASKRERRFRVVALDFGIKSNLLRELDSRGCRVEVLPANTTAEAILARKPHGVFLSNGPGDPAAAPYAAESVRKILGKVPLFGVCMGHQILGLALGAKTYKLKFGHRGGNQPVLDQGSGRVEISSHNHGYAIDGATLPPSAKVTHVNLNDKTVEGMSVDSLQAFSVQYHPEACPGPHDSVALFDRFVRAMEKGANVPKVS